MHKLITCFCVFLFSLSLTAQISEYPGQAYADLWRIAVDNNNIFTIGSCARGMYSTDDGVTWAFQDTPNISFLDMDILPGSNGEVALLLASNKLYRWNIKDETISEADVSALNAFGSFRDMLVTENKVYIISTGAINYADGTDLEWEKLTDIVYDEDYSITCSSINSEKIFIGSSKGHLFGADLETGTYEEIYKFDTRIQSLGMPDKEVGYASISGITNPYKTEDGGKSWDRLDNFPENNQLYAYDKNTVVFLNTNRHFVSTDGGENVTEVDTDLDAHTNLLTHATFSSNGDFYMAGYATTILKSTDFGLTYDNLNDFNKSNLRQIEFNENGYGIATGDQAILLTNDAGETWSSFDTDAIDVDRIYIEGATILGDDKYLVAHDEGVVIIKNGAITFEGDLGQIALHYNLEKDYIIGVTQISSDYVITKSTDGGETWENKYFMEEYVDQIESTPNGNIYILTRAGYYLLSSNDGEDWEKVEIQDGNFLLEMELLDDGTSLFSGAGKLFISSDGGVNTEKIGELGVFRNMHFIAPDHYVYSQEFSSGISFYEKLPDDPQPVKFGEQCATGFDSYFINNSLWLAQYGGHIGRIDLDAPSATTVVSIESLDLHPNPITLGSTLQLPAINENARLQIFNAMGGLVYEEKKWNSDQIQIGSHLFTAGVYLLKIETEAKSQLAKFVVIN